MLVGYARTSTADQEAGLAAQVRDLEAAGATRVFSEQVSSFGRRDQLAAALACLREGDTLVVSKPDRLARSTIDLLNILEGMRDRGVNVVLLSMGGQRVDTSSATGKLMVTMLAAVATFERDMMLERQREGIAKARADNRYKGRVPTARLQTEEVLRLREAKVTVTQIAQRLGMSRMSVYRILNGEAASEAEAA